ncbi:MAG: TraR/DksA C4-type zinc finger protein [Planctomycetota bacterium]
MAKIPKKSTKAPARKKAPARTKSAPKTTRKAVKKTAKKVVRKRPTAAKKKAAPTRKKVAKKTTTRKKAPAKKTVKKAAPKKTVRKKTAKKAPVKKTTAKKAPAKKAAPKKTAKKPAATTRKSTATKAAKPKATKATKAKAKAAPKPAETNGEAAPRFAAAGFSFDFGPKIDTDSSPAVEAETKTAAPATKRRGRNAAGFTAAEMRNFRALLVLKRAELVGDVSSMESEALRSEGTNLANLTEHMADRGTDNYEQEFTLDLVQKDRELLAEIKHALAKIDGKEDPPYGICEGTGQPIKKARLEVQPWARFSVDHARQLERTGR